MLSLWLIALLAPCAFAYPLETRAIPEKSCGVNKYANPSRDFQPYIAGGQDAKENAYPWHVAILYKGSFFCSGVIINENYILTNAWCIGGDDKEGLEVYAGKHNIRNMEPNQKSFKVAAEIKHEHYDASTKQNNIALLKLATPITFDEYIQPICLPSAQIGTIEDKTVTLTGWGNLYYGGGSPSFLREAALPTCSNAVCRQVMPSSFIDSGMLCAGYQAGGAGMCHLDEGGPVQMKVDGKWNLVGIASWSLGCGGSYQPDVYTRVSYYLSWIKTNAPDSAPPPS